MGAPLVLASLTVLKLVPWASGSRWISWEVRLQKRWVRRCRLRKRVRPQGARVSGLKWGVSPA